MKSLVPQYDSLSDVYPDLSAQDDTALSVRRRFLKLTNTFQQEFGHKPSFVARSPGRVNIIGEHIDYSMYSVLPAGIGSDVLIAVRVLPKAQDSLFSIKMANGDMQKYPRREITIGQSGLVEIDSDQHSWTNYILAGLRGSLPYLRGRLGSSFTPNDMEILVDGNIPPGGGQSSSAAFICASILSVMGANNYSISRDDLLELAVVSERAVGVFSGGMDQAASIFAERDCLIHCNFFPKFSTERISFPDSGCVFLIAQSFVTSEKAVTAPVHYNLRVLECTLAAVVLAKICDINLEKDESPLGYCLRNLQEQIMKKSGQASDSPETQLSSMIDIVNARLTMTSYTREEIAYLLQIPTEELDRRYISQVNVRAEFFKLRQRALHVLEEARRVDRFRNTLTNCGDLNRERLLYLGELMNQTQASCKTLYECSCPEIDQICSISRSSGAYGARLTGAGWGGGTVHIVPQDKVSAVINALRTEYYLKKVPGLSQEKLRTAISIFKPGQGSSLIGISALES
ncbi:galactokinase [Exophiala spinifera]|uniref:Galactokinase n=1 Tax=Exophiala spinifera TaxID=91928 RepID=A0A0D2B6S7_9EURO|nr:galactokinase [Exophiala spinifera]KIW14593.1 galactokinase [Exophiala spinifera]